MIKVCVSYDTKQIKRVVVKGHAMYDDMGKDIVCAAVSTLVVSTVNNILSIDSNVISVTNKDGYVDIIVNYDNEYASLLLTNMLKYMREIASKYPSNIKITDKEELL